MAGDPFLSDPSRKRKRSNNNKRTSVVGRKTKKTATPTPDLLNDEEISGGSDTDDEQGNVSVDEKEVGGFDDDEINSDDEFAGESTADKRRRLLKQYLENLKTEMEEEYGEFDALDLDLDIISTRLKKDAAEQKGYVYKFVADNLLLQDSEPRISRIGSMSLTSLSLHYPYCYTTSKDMELSKWDIRDFNKKPRRVKYVRGGSKFYEINKEVSKNGHVDEIHTVAASPNGKFVVTGGKDKRLIIWSTESLSPLKVIENKTKAGAFYGLTFRRNSDQLYAACGDLKIRTYSVNQLLQLETLYGHQDLVVDISALGQERCVTVGSRDRTAMLWKIAEETRLTFRGGDSTDKKRKKKRDEEEEKESEIFYAEGSIDVVSMIDDSHFVTGSDNGNISLWSTAKKKPQFTQRLAHGIIPSLTSEQISGEKSEELATKQIPVQNPYWITSIYALPFSNVFFSGSWNGEIKVWKLNEDLRSFVQIGVLPRAKGVVTRIEAIEEDTNKKNSRIRVFATLAKEQRLGRWTQQKGDGARNALYSIVINQQDLRS